MMLQIVLIAIIIWGLWTFAKAIQAMIFGKPRERIQITIRFSVDDEGDDRRSPAPPSRPPPQHEPEVLEAMRRKSKQPVSAP